VQGVPDDVEIAVFIGSFTAKPGAEGALAAILSRYVVLTRHEATCRNVDLITSLTRPGRFVVVEKWDSADDVQDHLNSALMTDMAREAIPSLAGQPELDLFDTISAHDLA
jgi:quinol monooxygenase YgiN